MCIYYHKFHFSKPGKRHRPLKTLIIVIRISTSRYSKSDEKNYSKKPFYEFHSIIELKEVMLAPRCVLSRFHPRRQFLRQTLSNDSSRFKQCRNYCAATWKSPNCVSLNPITSTFALRTTHSISDST